MSLREQTSLFPSRELSRPVNVASVPQLSPFRYPGGKTWLVPLFRRWIWSLPYKPAELIEPFAGGAIISLTAAKESLVDSVTFVELDENVASVWATIIDGDAEWLAEQILHYELTQDNVEEKTSSVPTSIRERAFITLLKNRTNHGGILAEGSGRSKYGENGKGISSRWYPETLCRRIIDIVGYRERLNFVHGDGFTLIENKLKQDNVIFFVDPPYTAAGKRAGRRLYTHHIIDHEALFELMYRVKGDFLMTYDDSEEIREFATAHGFDYEPVAMKNTHHAQVYELLISNNLNWARS